ncbi:MAG: hypothetical protein U5R31_13895 [Acidimicrobiia bacterium]|nr:hypothetical protein [Acidimicrobiia bacterium]
MIDAYHKPPSGELVPSEQANALADEFVELQAAFADLEARMEAEGRGAESALARLDRARSELAEAERAVAKPSMSSDDVAELERAHEEVIEAEKKASSRLGRKSGQKRLEEAQQHEQEILDRIGFPTWSAYVMGSSLLNIDPAAEQRLERAREEMSEAEAEWARTSEMLENDPEYSELLDRLEAVYLVAFDILGGDDEGDLEQRLRDVRVPEEEVPREDIVRALVYQLELRGVDIADDALPDVVVAAAEGWLADNEDHWDRYRSFQEEQVRVENELAAAQRELDSLGIAAEELVGTRDELEQAVEQAEAKVSEILGDLEQATELESELEAQVEARAALMGAAKLSVTAAEAKLADVEARATAPPPSAGVSSPEVKDTSLYDSLPYAADEGGGDGDGDGEGEPSADELEFYLVSRLSSLRSVSHAGSVPLLIDDARAGRRFRRRPHDPRPPRRASPRRCRSST